MIIKWSSPTLSGLCDRLVDLFLVASFAKYHNAELYLDWPRSPKNTSSPQSWINDGKQETWKETRYYDYLFENFSQYFSLPDFIKINTEKPRHDYEFGDYLGGIYSPISFHSKFLSQDLSLEQYLELFYSVTKLFLPTDKLKSLVLPISEPYVSIHIRRGDKVKDSPNGVEIKKTELEDLNERTTEAINKILKSGINKLHFCSDDDHALSFYREKYKEFLFNCGPTPTGIESTYVDLYMLIQSKAIILSQKYSSFSFFASMVGRKELIYLYSGGQIAENRYAELKTSIFYKNI